MNQERIEIKLSKTKGVLTFLGSVAFVLVSIWLISFADNQHRYSQTFVKGAGYVGLIFFGLCGLYIFYKLFDTKPGLVIDDKGILDNSSAASGHIIKWDRIVGLRIGQVKSTKFILIDIVDPEQFLNEVSGMTKTLMWGTYKMYGTPPSISSSTLNIAKPNVAPFSAIIASAKAGARASSASAAFISNARRVPGPVAAHAGKAAAARAAMAGISAAIIAGAEDATSPVTGFNLSNNMQVPPDRACKACLLYWQIIDAKRAPRALATCRSRGTDFARGLRIRMHPNDVR